LVQNGGGRKWENVGGTELPSTSSTKPPYKALFVETLEGFLLKMLNRRIGGVFKGRETQQKHILKLLNSLNSFGIF
jgi:hypothetical protein